MALRVRTRSPWPGAGEQLFHQQREVACCRPRSHSKSLFFWENLAPKAKVVQTVLICPKHQWETYPGTSTWQGRMWSRTVDPAAPLNPALSAGGSRGRRRWWAQERELLTGKQAAEAVTKDLCQSSTRDRQRIANLPGVSPAPETGVPWLSLGLCGRAGAVRGAGPLRGFSVSALCLVGHLGLIPRRAGECWSC